MTNSPVACRVLFSIRKRIAATLLLIAIHLAPGAAAQCTSGWVPSDGYRGTNGQVLATTSWDPDGAGPRAPVFVAGGGFNLVAITTQVNNIVAYDPGSGTWSTFGVGMDGYVSALAVLPNGHLIAGGSFATAGGLSAANIARWDGTAWAPLGIGTTGAVEALEVMPNGDLVAGGSFASAGGVPANGIARWDGATWSPLGTGVQHPNGGVVYALSALPNGHLAAGGQFTTAGGVAANYVASWDGTTWSPLGSGLAQYGFYPPVVRAIASLPNGDLVVGNDLSTLGCTARWDGTSWSSMGVGGTGGSAFALQVMPNGDLVVGGSFGDAGGVSANGIARWDGATWSPLGTGMGPLVPTPPPVQSLTSLPGGLLFAGGSFTTAGGVRADHLASWDGGSWLPLGGPVPVTGMDGSLSALLVCANGDVVAGGDFATAGGVGATRIARRHGNSWSPLGTGCNGRVHAVLELPNGDVIAGGSFTTAGGVSTGGIARWDGVAWTSLGLAGTVLALARMPNGDLVIGGNFVSVSGVSCNRIARWNGSTWSPLGTGLGSTVNALAVLANGDLIAGGQFTTAGGASASRIARWNGSSWSALGPGANGTVRALAVLPSGDLVIGGFFTSMGGVSCNRIARWNGLSWSLGAGMDNTVYSLTVLPSGDLVAGGSFTTAGGTSASHVARWDGASWSPVGSGVSGTEVDALAAMPDGGFVAGGWFSSAGGFAAPYFARYGTCVSSYAVFGAGCAGTFGVPGNTANVSPRIGGTTVITVTGMAQNVGLFMIGSSNTMWNAAPLPIDLGIVGAPGCKLRVSDDIDMFIVGSGNAARLSLSVPNSTVFLAIQFYTQCLVLDPPATALGWIASDAAAALIGQ